MSDGLSTEPYKGVRDFYPEEWGRFTAMFSKVREVLTRAGYEEYQASPLEHSELYESKGNEEIIREQTFTFEDRGGRRVTLRPEMTPTLARMVAHKRRELVFPLRWFSMGNRFRYERPQKGRLREFYQCDVDLIGLPEGAADREVLALAGDIIKAFGANERDFSIRINSRALMHAAAKASGLGEGEAAREYWRLVDRKEKMSAEEFEQERTKGPDPLRAIEEGTDAEVASEKAKIETLVADMRAQGMSNISFDPSIVRGFDYYTGMVFEVNDNDAGNPRALFGGGRYDGLVSLFGVESIPAVGFAFGDVTLMEFLSSRGLMPAGASAPSLYLGTPSREDIPRAQAFATRLRSQGVRVFTNLTERSLGDQVKEAVKRGIPYFAAYGAEEERSRIVRLKKLAKSEETEVPAEELAARIGGK